MCGTKLCKEKNNDVENVARVINQTLRVNSVGTVRGARGGGGGGGYESKKKLKS